jgi:hypothetical protein
MRAFCPFFALFFLASCSIVFRKFSKTLALPKPLTENYGKLAEGDEKLWKTNALWKLWVMENLR